MAVCSMSSGVVQVVVVFLITLCPTYLMALLRVLGMYDLNKLELKLKAFCMISISKSFWTYHFFQHLVDI